MMSKVRIASRTEGDWVVFYIANIDTMEGAQKILTIHTTVLSIQPDAWERCKDISVDFFQKFLSEKGIKTSGWEVEPAPEHEIAGRS